MAKTCLDTYLCVHFAHRYIHRIHRILKLKGNSGVFNPGNYFLYISLFKNKKQSPGFGIYIVKLLHLCFPCIYYMIVTRFLIQC